MKGRHPGRQDRPRGKLDELVRDNMVLVRLSQSIACNRLGRQIGLVPEDEALL